MVDFIIPLNFEGDYFVEPIRYEIREDDPNSLWIDWNEDIALCMPEEYFFDTNTWVHEFSEMTLHFLLTELWDGANNRIYVLINNDFASVNILAHCVTSIHATSGIRRMRKEGGYDDIQSLSRSDIRFLTSEEIEKFKNFIATFSGEVNDDEN